MMISRATILLSFSLGLLMAVLSSCELPQATVATHEEMTRESARLHAFLHQYDSLCIAQDPLYATRQGSRIGHGHLTGNDDAHLQDELGMLTAWRERLLREFDTARLDPSAQLNRNLFLEYVERRSASYAHRRLTFPEDPLPTPGTITLFSQLHPLETPADADAFVNRLGELPPLLVRWRMQLEQRMADSLLPSRDYLREVRRRHVHPAGIVTLDSHLVADPAHPWLQRLSAFLQSNPELSGRKATLERKAWEAYSLQIIPEYDKILDWFFTAEAEADTFAVAGQLAGGREWYGYQLSVYSGRAMTGDEAYTYGLQKLEKLQQELAKLLASERYPGGVPFYLDSLRRARDLYMIPTQPQGRQDFISSVQVAFDSLRGKTPEVIETMPSGTTLFRFTESADSLGDPFRWKMVSDDSLLVQCDLGLRPKLELWRWRAQLSRVGPHGEALAAMFAQQRRDSVYAFRREMEEPWFVKGWGLYSLRLPLTEGWYKDTAWYRSVILEEMRATALLLADVGMHHQKWSRKQAVDYLVQNTAMSLSEVNQEIRRILLQPGANAAPVLGCAIITQWRDQLRSALGERFSLPAFHYLLLRNGALPADLLDRQIKSLAPSPSESES